MPMKTPSQIWFNGEFIPWNDAKVHVFSHAIHYGSSVFEGIRAYSTRSGTGVWCLPQHVDRLFFSARVMHMAIPYTRAEISAAICETVRVSGFPSCYIRPIAFRGYDAIGVHPGTCPVDVAIGVIEWGKYLGPEAIEQGGHTMIYSLSPGDVHHPTHLPYYKRANMLRITRDIWDDPLSIEKGFWAWDNFQGVSGLGFWPDLDMIPFGRLEVVNERARQSTFNQNQMKTFITQRAMAASPLLIGGDLLTMDDFSYSLLTNKEMLACNQNGVMGVNVYRAGNIDIWLTPHKINPAMGWIGIFNRSKSDRKVTLTKQDLGFIAFEASYNLTAARQNFRLKDIWSDESISIQHKHTFALPSEGVAFLKFQMQ